MSVNTRSAAFQHVLSVLNFGQDITDHLKEQWYINVGHLVSVSDTDIADLKDECRQIFKLGHRKTNKFFKKCITDYLINYDNTVQNDWTTEFNIDKFEEFVIIESIKATNINNIKASTEN